MAALPNKPANNKGNGGFQYVEFKFDNNNLNSFQRLSSFSDDCVFNAFELLGVLDHVEAGKERNKCNAERNGKGPHSLNKIVQFLKFKKPDKECLFRRMTEQEFLNFCDNKVEKSKAYFCGVYSDDGNCGHIFILSRDANNGKVKYIDPQVPKAVLDLKSNEVGHLIWRNAKMPYVVLVSRNC